ncbi:MAG: twin-arginine translocase TatA/TatE family subunit [Thermaerobacter sp.]|nr:twin-arginine translocase TatA/TatE family subunit [Thermaerobacter sp.]
MFGNLIDPVHIIVLGVVVVWIFGPKRLPELSASLGKTIRLFKHSLKNSDPDTDG